MTSMPRTFGLLALLFAVGCGSSQTSAPGANGDVSENEVDATSRFTSLETASDPDVQAFFAATAKFEGSYRGVYRFNKAGPEATDPDARMNRVKEVMHRYMCRFFEDGIELVRRTGDTAVTATLDDVALRDNADSPKADTDALSTTLGALFERPELDVMSGSASGNNTGGEVMGVYDSGKNEVVFFGFTNCGSDD